MKSANQICAGSNAKRTTPLLAVLIVQSVMISLVWRPAAAQKPPSPEKEATSAFTAVGYRFEGPPRVPAGLVTLRLENRGTRAHMLGVLRLAGEATAADVLAAAWDYPATPLPPFVTWASGPAAVDPSGMAEATVALDPGRYALVCLMPDGDRGVTHLARGMIRPLEVQGLAVSHAQTPAADVTVDLREFSYTFDLPIRAGLQTVRVRNRGQQRHELQVARLPGGVTVEDYVALNDATSPTAGSSYGGLAPLEPGAEALFTADFLPGRYAFLSFVIDPVTGQPDFRLGMRTQFEVE